VKTGRSGPHNYLPYLYISVTTFSDEMQEKVGIFLDEEKILMGEFLRKL